MGEQAMIADRQTKAGDQPHAEKQADFNRSNRPIDQQAERNQGAEERQDVENDKMSPMQLMEMTAADDSKISHLGPTILGNHLVSLHRTAKPRNPISWA